MDANEFRQVFPRLARSLSEAETKSLLVALTPRTYVDGARLSTFGERTDTLHLITSGQVAIRATQAGEIATDTPAVPLRRPAPDLIGRAKPRERCWGEVAISPPLGRR